MNVGTRLLVYGLFLGSGATALVYQVSWTRNLSLIFGASYEAISIVLASFMAGQAMGALYFGRRAKGVARPLRVYGWLEIGVAAFALILPLLLRLVNEAYVSAAISLGGTHGVIDAVRPLMAFLVLVLPTFLMGATLPILIEFSVQRDAEFGSRLSALYAINTAGAVIGTLAAGFLLLPELGVSRTQLLAVAGNTLIGVVAILADRLAGPARAPANAGAGPVVAASPAPDQREPAADDWGLRLAFWGTAVSGTGALALEVMWSRGIAVAMGSTIYSFTIMLAAFLVGIALGSGLHALFPLRRIHVSVQFGAVLILIGLTSLAVSQLIPRLPLYSLELNLWFYGGSVGIRGVTTLLLSFLIMLVPCTFMGVAFPLAGEARDRLMGSHSQSVGELVGLNTSGAILGSLLAGFVIVPLVGLERGMLMASAITLAYGLLVLWVMVESVRPELRGRAALATLVLFAAIVSAALLIPRWSTRTLAALPNNDQQVAVDSDGNVDLEGFLDRTQILYYREGRGSTVVAIGSEFGFRSLHVNGKAVASDGATALQIQYLLGHLPVLLHPEPRSAVVVGLGTGVTLAGVAAHSEIEDLTLVEIEPAVLGAAAHFVHVNDDAMHDPRVTIVYHDGRNFFHTTDQKFDVITADPIHPWAQGASYLYTIDYFRLVAEHLTEVGVMCQWLPLYELSEEHLQSVAASFSAVFEHTSLWQAGGDALLIGSRVPLELNLETLSQRLKEERVAEHLSRIGIDGVLPLLAELTMDEAAIRRFADGAIINTDDNLYLEFASPLTYGRSTVQHNMRLIDSHRGSPRGLLDGVVPFFSSEAQADSVFERYRQVKSVTVLADTQRSESIESLTKVVQQLRRAVKRLPEYHRPAQVLGGKLGRLGRLQLAEGRLGMAVSSFLEAARADPNSTVAANNLAWILATSPAIANPSQAIAHAERAVQLAPYPDPSTLDTLAVAYAAGSDFDRAVSHAREALELATAAGYRSLARDIRKRLALYEQGLPYREDPAVHPVGG
ncbi:MAG: fused MFS/spermidine synthase [Myxococcales bacterium]|nr:fused MFS/spermidine synthase [Myxococcales bacterium]